VGAPDTDAGLLAITSGVTATIGGPGAQANTFSNYTQYNFIKPSDSGIRNNCPRLTIIANRFLQNGQAVDPSSAIFPC
jgi:hypothetical protein